MSRLPVVVNPAARGGRRRVPRERIERAAAARRLAVEWWETAAPGHATELAARAARDRVPILAVWGGDGTYNEAARGLVGSETALLALPGGTTSVLAYEFGIPRDPQRALEVQLDGARRAMAVARTDRGQVFLLMLSVGPDATILANIPAPLKRRAGKLGIGVQACVEFLRGGFPRFSVAANGAELQASWCIVGKSRSYAGPYAATPAADPFALDFDVVTLTRHGRASLLPFFFAIPSGRHLHMRGVERASAREVRLEGEGVPYQLDGDAAGELPVTARSSGDRLWVMVPAAAR
ncbi:MAG TPA: diacylglycerol kinase family protein [Thermoanaerobaculaceae bacterium]|nr:diacylglycerol kinase family protein [Thermoanaerobaculaceae bacterium]